MRVADDGLRMNRIVEKDKDFDLMEALNRSDALPIASAELHMIVTVIHCII